MAHDARVNFTTAVATWRDTVGERLLNVLSPIYVEKASRAGQ